MLGRDPVAQRALWLKKLAEGLQSRAEELTAIITAELGMPLKFSQRIQTALPLTNIEFYAGLNEAFAEEGIGHGDTGAGGYRQRQRLWTGRSGLGRGGSAGVDCGTTVKGRSGGGGRCPYNLLASFGGYKQSGNGFEFGPYGLEKFLEIESPHLLPK